MKKRLLYVAALAAGALLISGCGKSSQEEQVENVVLNLMDEDTETLKASGTMKEASYEVSDGEYKLVADSFPSQNASLDIQIKSGTETGCKLTADDNLLEYLSVEVDDSAKTITITADSGYSYENLSLNVELTADVNEIQASGSYAISYEDVAVDSLKVSLEGTCSLTAAGACESLELVTSGTSAVKAYDLEAGNVSADASGTSVIEVTAADSLTAEASGVSSITYAGNPADVKEDASSTSTIEKK